MIVSSQFLILLVALQPNQAFLPLFLFYAIKTWLENIGNFLIWSRYFLDERIRKTMNVSFAWGLCYIYECWKCVYVWAFICVCVCLYLCIYTYIYKELLLLYTYFQRQTLWISISIFIWIWKEKDTSSTQQKSVNLTHLDLVSLKITLIKIYIISYQTPCKRR